MSAPGDAATFTLRFLFRGDLSFFVRASRGAQEIVRQAREKTSVKDAIEACGVPHPEVALIVIDGAPVDFSHQLQADAIVEVYPVPAPVDLFPESRLQRGQRTKFVADGHLGKLTRNLRLLGMDVAYDPRATDSQLIALATKEDRALLTRDRRLLMHAIVRDGYCPRSQAADAQTVEVIRRFNLPRLICAFTRCSDCNAPLAVVAKSKIVETLEPLTRLYYEDFRQCTGCGKVYWPGSHFSKLQARIERICAQLKAHAAPADQK